MKQTLDVRMYIEEFILVEISIHCCTKLTVKMYGKYTGICTIATKDEECENCS